MYPYWWYSHQTTCISHVIRWIWHTVPIMSRGAHRDQMECVYWCLLRSKNRLLLPFLGGTWRLLSNCVSVLVIQPQNNTHSPCDKPHTHHAPRNVLWPCAKCSLMSVQNQLQPILGITMVSQARPRILGSQLRCNIQYRRHWLFRGQWFAVPLGVSSLKACNIFSKHFFLNLFSYIWGQLCKYRVGISHTNEDTHADRPVCSPLLDRWTRTRDSHPWT